MVPVSYSVTVTGTGWVVCLSVRLSDGTDSVSETLDDGSDPGFVPTGVGRSSPGERLKLCGVPV